MGEDRTCYGGRALTRLIGLAYPAGCSLLLAQARPDAGTESYTMESQAAWRNAKDGQLSPPKTDTHPRWWGGEGFNANSVNLKSLTNEIVSSLPIAWKKEKENGSKMLMPPAPMSVIGWQAGWQAGIRFPLEFRAKRFTLLALRTAQAGDGSGM